MFSIVRIVIHAIREGPTELNEDLLPTTDNVGSNTNHLKDLYLRTGALLIFLAAGTLSPAQDLKLNAKVTYLLACSVYISAGRVAGVVDSTTLFAVTGTDTIAALKVFAVSSKSAVCRILTARRELVVGDDIVGLVQAPKEEKLTAVVFSDSAGRAGGMGQVSPTQELSERPLASSVAIQGRIGLQYLTSQFEQSVYNINQPAVVIGVRARARDLPLSLEIYGNLRMLSRGGTNPFSGRVSNESRIYRLSLEYDDHVNTVTMGRILSYYAPSIGSIDGMSYTRKIGSFVLGAAVGFQPDLKQQGVSTDTRKLSLYARYQDEGFHNLALTAAYARTYLTTQLDREAVSFGVTAYSSDGFSVYGYSDLDVRRKNEDRFEISPALSSGILMCNYRLFDFLSVGMGADASRPVYQFSSVQYLSDSLVDRTLRSGATVSINIMLPNGLSLYNTYTPRSSDGAFGGDYANSSSFSWYNLLSTGTMVRATYNLTSNSFATAQGYGVNLQRTLFGVDCTIRYQQSRYKVSQIGQTNTSKTFGVDIMTLLTRRLSWLASFDLVRGYGSAMNSLFTELSWRF